MSPRVRLLAALLPVLGLAALVVRSELAQRGNAFRLDIRGYDPRDLISGRYLRYQFELDWQGEPSCGQSLSGRDRSLDPTCCVCLTRVAGHPASPAVHLASCDAVQSCDGWLHAEQLQAPKRYFIPEDSAVELERALSERKAAVDVVASTSGSAAVGELYLDGQPWREALEKHPSAP
ncbi:MAG: hypothetical protein RL033_7908 [Pseudomonadota bacterium]